MTALETAIVRRLTELTRTARMWGSPEELEAVAMHFSHVLLSTGTEGWTLEQTFERWQALGAPFAQDAEEHAAMRSKMWGEEVVRARTQVVEGFLVVWTGLQRLADREGAFTPWIERLLDFPDQAGTPDRLNMTLFALMGFVAADPQAYVGALRLERHRIGGHELRALPIVGPPGPIDAAHTYTRNFVSWARVTEGITAVNLSLQSGERAAQSAG